MTLLQLQQQIADVLNDDETLAQGGCRAFAEDSRTVEQDVAERLQQVGGVAAVVSTTAGRPAGRLGGGIQIDVDIAVSAAEIPAISRMDPSRMTALQAMQRAILLLDGPELEFTGFRQDFNEQAGLATATCDFTTQVALTEE